MKNLIIMMWTKSKLNYNFVISFFIFIVFSILFWNRYIRVKTPYKIPYQFNAVIYLFLVMSLCLTFYYLICNFLGKQNNTIITILYNKIIIFDKYIKTSSFYEILLKNYFVIFFEKTSKVKHIYIYMEILPRIILLSVLLAETFYYNYIDFFLNILVIAIIPLLFKYLIFSFKDNLSQSIAIIDKQAEIFYIFPQGPQMMSSKTLIDYLIKNDITLRDNLYEVSAHLSFLSERRKRLNLPDNVRLDRVQFKKKIKGAIHLCYEMQKYLLEQERLRKRFFYFNLFVSFLYIICTLYIIYTSFYLINFSAIINYIEIISKENMNCGEEPFSGLFL
jgi:hypothetical protein